MDVMCNLNELVDILLVDLYRASNMCHLAMLKMAQRVTNDNRNTCNVSGFMGPHWQQLQSKQPTLVIRHFFLSLWCLVRRCCPVIG